MFTQQFHCTVCGHHTPVADDGKHSFGDELYGDQHSNWDAFCTCHECKTLFHRKVVNGETQNCCRFCGSTNITIHDELHPLACPVCGQRTLEIDSSTVSSYF